ncbi:hypothetical protein AVEN_49348-1 [Araneus ventricosus]|uniref:Uncharacterized protein n=1 Tax=Araneus ventricosus TaxID=182803 RepID=A0A4Y2LRN8_ARAVE|nr:hypothetical protein AVEN_49348-1 [Araneus ventricosus]
MFLKKSSSFLITTPSQQSPYNQCHRPRKPNPHLTVLLLLVLGKVQTTRHQPNQQHLLHLIIVHLQPTEKEYQRSHSGVWLTIAAPPKPYNRITNHRETMT